MEEEDNLDVAEEMDNSLEEPIEEPVTDEPSEEELEVEEDNLSDEDEPLETTPEKFKSSDAQEKSYLALERKLSELGEENARLRKEVERSSLSPEERDVFDQNQAFIKQNDLMTKAEFEQMQRDEQESLSLIKAGATQHQLERVKRISRFEGYNKMSITEIYRDLYGFVPKSKPKQGVKPKPRKKVVKNKAFTYEEIKAMSPDERKRRHAEIIARGVQQV